MCEIFLSAGIYAAPKKHLQCMYLNGTEDFYEVDFQAGEYMIEVWGAAGGAATLGRINKGGNGGYASGFINVKNRRKFYFYVGTAGKNANGGTPGSAGYNGGAIGGNDPHNNDCASGGSGGATDMRILSGAWNDETSLQSRIIVAGGGGSGGCYLKGGEGGHGGGLSGTKGSDNEPRTAIGGEGGTQISGYKLGEGQRGTAGNDAGGSGGGGHWGGYGGGSTPDAIGGAGGGGGSSYVSGHPNCSVNSLYSFESTKIIAGNDPSLLVVNNYGSGLVKIVTVSIYSMRGKTCKVYNRFETLLPLLFYIIVS
jgi:hypothetical protein